MLGERVLEQLLVSVPNSELPPSFRTQSKVAAGGGGAAAGGGGGKGGGRGPTMSAASTQRALPSVVKSPAEVWPVGNCVGGDCLPPSQPSDNCVVLSALPP